MKLAIAGALLALLATSSVTAAQEPTPYEVPCTSQAAYDVGWRAGDVWGPGPFDYYGPYCPGVPALEGTVEPTQSTNPDYPALPATDTE